VLMGVSVFVCLCVCVSAGECRDRCFSEWASVWLNIALKMDEPNIWCKFCNVIVIS
jgi:hypothetical protein